MPAGEALFEIAYLVIPSPSSDPKQPPNKPPKAERLRENEGARSGKGGDACDRE